MPALTIVIGGNGAGKSTWCSRNRERLPDHFYDADSLARGLGGWNDAERPVAVGAGSSNLAYTRHGRDFVYGNQPVPNTPGPTSVWHL